MKIKMMTDIEFNEFKIKIGMESKPEESCTRRKGKKNDLLETALNLISFRNKLMNITILLSSHFLSKILYC